MNIEIGVRPDSFAERLNDEDPLNILLIGNFSGHGQQPASAGEKAEILNKVVERNPELRGVESVPVTFRDAKPTFTRRNDEL